VSYKLRPTNIQRHIGTIIIGILVGILALWSLSNIASETSFEPIKTDTVEVIEPAQPSEEELRRIEWEKEAEAVKAQHLKKKELEHERATLLEEVKERETRIKELEKELGF
jgi:hypothetical protein